MSLLAGKVFAARSFGASAALRGSRSAEKYSASSTSAVMGCCCETAATEGLSAVPGSLPSIAGVTVSCRQTVLPWESDLQNVSMAR